MREHICREIRYCSCMNNALDPSEDCVIHGDYRQSRCSYCGRFLMNSPEKDILDIIYKHELWHSYVLFNEEEWIKIKLPKR